MLFRSVLTEHEAGWFRVRCGRPRLERGDALQCRRFDRRSFRRGQFKLRSLAMLRTNFYEGVERARRNVQSEPLLKEASHVTVSLPFATQFPDQVAMGFQLGARRFGREVGKSLKNDLRVNICGGRKWMHRYPVGRQNRRLTTVSRSLGGSLGISLGNRKIGPH